jgi:uncharacterized membrane protein
MSPVAAMEPFCLILTTGEDRELAGREQYQPRAFVICVVLLTGLMACVLNLTTFLATSSTSPLTVTMVRCMKQVVTIMLSVVIFDKKLTWANWCGVIVATIGSLWYGLLKQRRPVHEFPLAVQSRPREVNPGPLSIPRELVICIMSFFLWIFWHKSRFRSGGLCPASTLTNSPVSRSKQPIKQVTNSPSSLLWERVWLTV